MPPCCTTRIRATCRATSRRWSDTWRRRLAISPGDPRDMTSDPDRALLLRVARESIEAFVGVSAAHVTSGAGILGTAGGVFVTLHNHGDLRGCIGHIEADEP